MAKTFAFLLVRDFTLSPLSLFIDTLRLAGDEGDRSRRVEFDWQILGERGLPIRSSCGIELLPTRAIGDPEDFDNIVIVGGLLDPQQNLSQEKEAFLLRAAERGVHITALCTGSFVLARYGLLNGYDACVSWFHIKDFRQAFPDVRAQADGLYCVDRKRSTCAGGTGAADLAGYFVLKSIGPRAAEKAAKILVMDRIRNSYDVQPIGDLFPEASSRAVKRALLLMESSLQETITVSDIAAKLNVSRRQLERLFAIELEVSPMAAYLAVRLQYAKSLLEATDLQIGEIGFRCGFGNAGHFSRVFRQHIGVTPTDLRNQYAAPKDRSREPGTPASGRRQ
ncbi:GlxA family transcriptional regulator [Mesorhizobium caraganae]|uniref:GlxA family transcriptional regulator n=1 Tax=Mesorhizobium caraganae TaxID=483206 RepID=UPI00178245FD|nr:GlxA family transcriptional regulator [Mesorhizobium caraganae]